MNEKTYMKKIIIISAILFLAAFGLFSALKKNNSLNNFPSAPAANTGNSPQNSSGNVSVSQPQNALSDQNLNSFQPSLDRASERITKKPFGIFVSPQNSPVQPERFRGWHTGTDFEIFPDELDSDISVRAICSGKIAVKRFASGYSGVLVQSCELDNQPITAIYGHLKLASISKNAGDNLSAGETIGLLGKANSAETDGERKHLHLGVHKGSATNILGYAQSQTELSNWIDPCSIASVCN